MDQLQTRALNRITDGRQRIACARVALLLLFGGEPRATESAAPQRLPAALEKYLAAAVHLSSSERRTLVSGAPVTKLLDGIDAGKEVAVFAAVWINASPSTYVQRVKDIENFERGGAFKITKRISDRPKPEDFTQLGLPKEDIEDLQTFRMADCERQSNSEGRRVLCLSPGPLSSGRRTRSAIRIQ